MRHCEVMSKIVCNASNLKVDCYQYKEESIRRTYCELCNNFSVEDARHIIMHCPALTGIRNELFNEISHIEQENSVTILREQGDV